MAGKIGKNAGKSPQKSKESPFLLEEPSAPTYATSKSNWSGKSSQSSQLKGRQSASSSQSVSSSSDLKSREYKDKQGNIHYHTRSYMAKGKK